MRTVFAIGLAWFGGIALVSAGPDAASLLKRLETSRAKLPAFGAIYRESVHVPGSKGASPDHVVQGQRTQLSWGDRDTSWLYEYAFGPKGSYSHLIGDPADPTFKQIAEKGLVLGSKYYRSVSDGHQGAISERKPGLVNPAGAGYEIFMGEPVADLLSANKPTLVDPLTLQVKDQARTVTIHLVDQKGQWAVDRIVSAYDSGMIETITVNSWRPFKGSMVPAKVTLQRTRGGSPIQTIDYELVKPLAKPEQLLVWQGWQENAIVKDTSTQVIYKYTGGKLILHPMFNKGASTTVTLQRGVAILGALLLAFWLIRAIKARTPRTDGPRLRQPARSAPTGSLAEAPTSGGTATRIPDSR